MLAHEKLNVYSKALDFAARAARWLSAWDKKHAIVDHFSRANESILLNLADAARQRDAPGRLAIIDCSIGSALECAACLDIARIKAFLSADECNQEKQCVCEITKMLVGLRKAWDAAAFKEVSLPYGAESSPADAAPLFLHERLDVYRAALEFIHWFVSKPGGKETRGATVATDG